MKSPYLLIFVPALTIGVLSLGVLSAQESDSDNPSAPEPAETTSATPTAESQKLTIRGEVVWLRDVLQQQLGVKLDDDAPKVLVLATSDGQLHPIMKEGRGRAFYQDERLRGRPMQLAVNHWPGVPFVQVSSVYSIKEGQLYAVDYWCDTCAIPAYDVRSCPCCQNIFGPMRLRETPVDKPLAN